MDTKYTILCVDDEESILKCLVRLLEPEGYIVLTAANGQVALKVLEANNVDLVITDQRMPIMDGSWLLRNVKKQYPGILSIMLSGYSDFDALVRALNDGEVFHFLTKPWDNDELKIIIKRALDQKRMALVMRRIADEARAVLNISNNVQVDFLHDTTGVTLKVGEDGVVFSDETIFKFLQFIFSSLGVNRDIDLKMVSGVVIREKGTISMAIDLGKGMTLKIEAPRQNLP
jgi:CheY-like chemotaxis protein